jgi:hypothetical protein
MDLPEQKPAGSKLPSGEIAPGRPPTNLDASYFQPLTVAGSLMTTDDEDCMGARIAGATKAGAAANARASMMFVCATARSRGFTVR